MMRAIDLADHLNVCRRRCSFWRDRSRGTCTATRILSRTFASACDCPKSCVLRVIRTDTRGCCTLTCGRFDYVNAVARLQEVDQNDEILSLLNDIVNRCLVATPSQRPTSVQINHKIAELIRQLTRGLNDDPAKEW